MKEIWNYFKYERSIYDVKNKDRSHSFPEILSALETTQEFSLFHKEYDSRKFCKATNITSSY